MCHPHREMHYEQTEHQKHFEKHFDTRSTELTPYVGYFDIIDLAIVIPSLLKDKLYCPCNYKCTPKGFDNLHNLGLMRRKRRK